MMIKNRLFILIAMTAICSTIFLSPRVNASIENWIAAGYGLPKEFIKFTYDKKKTKLSITYRNRETTISMKVYRNQPIPYMMWLWDPDAPPYEIDIGLFDENGCRFSSQYGGFFVYHDDWHSPDYCLNEFFPGADPAVYHSAAIQMLEAINAIRFKPFLSPEYHSIIGTLNLFKIFENRRLEYPFLPSGVSEKHCKHPSG